MADRVACICGSKSGIDHTPLHWIFSDASPDRYQVTLGISELCFAYWRVKKWRVHGSVAGTHGGTLTATFDYLASIGDDDSGDPTTVDREAKLVVPRMILQSDDPGGASGVVLFSMFEFNLLTGGLLKPRCEFSLFADGVGAFISTAKDATYATAIAGIAAKIVIDGTDHALTFYKAASDAGTYSGTFTVEPSEYWPYATKEGLPVYNTATGAQLRDPFS